MLLFTGSVEAQNILSNRDSLPIGKPKALQSRYLVNHQQLGEIRMVTKEIRELNTGRENFWHNLTGGAVTLLSGLHTSSSGDAIWFSENELISSDPSYSWQIPIFMHGEAIRDRKTVRNEDGSRSVESHRAVFLDWNNGVFGLILERGDTLGRFTLLPDQSMDSSGFFWLSRLDQDNRDLTAMIRKYEPYPVNTDFMVKGEFRGREFSLVSSGRDYRSLILSEEKPLAVFQSEPNFIMLNKKNRITPYLLISREAESIERADLIRLGLLNALLAQVLREDSQSE